VVLGDANLVVKFEVRVYRSKRLLNALAERMWLILVR
jgi:hypothetical protein